VGVRGGVEEELAARAGVPFRAIESGQVRGMALWVATRNLLKAGRGVAQAGRLIAEFQPDVVFVTGGFVAGPVALAAWRAHVPVFIYLPDMEPGLTVRRTSRSALQRGRDLARGGALVPRTRPWSPAILCARRSWRWLASADLARQRLGLAD
jgi:UDP-N-acetylglucosamine:LPS N-acetylglucosamine transferase